MKTRKLIVALLSIASVLMSCDSKGQNSPIEAPVKTDDNKKDEPVLKDAAFHIGCAADYRTLFRDQKYREVIAREFSSITPGNEMKMTALLTNGSYDETTGKWSLTFDFSSADKMINFATANGIRVHAHTLVWYKDGRIPDCLKVYDDATAKQSNKEIWVSFLKEYITTVCTHFRGKVASWDVVNEALSDAGSQLRGECERDRDLWYNNIGKEYINLAFQYAHEADPDALLFYNDYGTEYLYYKRVALATLAKRLIKEGVPIDGIGLQTHTYIDAELSQEKLDAKILNLTRTIDNVINCGLMVHVSEMDVKICPENQTVAEDEIEARLEVQKAIYKAVAEKLKSLPEEKVFGLTMWGVKDDNGDYGKNYKTLLFNENYDKKPSYYGILETIDPKN